ncbi:hypothetical protein [Frankia sp. CiP3]|uniref:hypothetical protein n=1 Tax=Frankia sp. CiP3 TaxID=2880971 RepID=UPI001EF43292|nr:hypothetical protein [Frankia sp. CiP3]
MNAARRGAFDPNRLDDVDDLLGPPPVPPPAMPAPTPVGTQPPASDAVDVPPSPARRGKGTGGRPPTASRQGARTSTGAEADRGTRPAAVRVPRDLYLSVVERLLSGVERPSYGQLVAWTCEDYPDEVLNALPRTAPGARIPRGRRLAAESVQVTLRGDAELPVIDQLAARAEMTRTAVTIAALTVAMRHAGEGGET